MKFYQSNKRQWKKPTLNNSHSFRQNSESEDNFIKISKSKNNDHQEHFIKISNISVWSKIYQLISNKLVWDYLIHIKHINHSLDSLINRISLNQ
jgi:hypothetical protein